MLCEEHVHRISAVRTSYIRYATIFHRGGGLDSVLKCDENDFEGLGDLLDFFYAVCLRVNGNMKSVLDPPNVRAAAKKKKGEAASEAHKGEAERNRDRLTQFLDKVIREVEDFFRQMCERIVASLLLAPKDQVTSVPPLHGDKAIVRPGDDHKQLSERADDDPSDIIPWMKDLLLAGKPAEPQGLPVEYEEESSEQQAEEQEGPGDDEDGAEEEGIMGSATIDSDDDEDDDATMKLCTHQTLIKTDVIALLLWLACCALIFVLTSPFCAFLSCFVF